MEEQQARLGVCNIGVTRYPIPLSSTHRKKFRALSALADFHIIAISESGGFGRFEERAQFYLVPHQPYAVLRFLALISYSLWRGMRLLRSGRVQVILCESPYEALAGLLLRRIGRWLGQPAVLVIELHGDWEEAPFLYRRIPLASLARVVLSRWTRFALRRSDLLRPISRFLQQKAERAAPSVRSVVFPTYTNIELFLQVGTRPVNASPRFLFVGALYPVKGVSVLLEAMSMLVERCSSVQLDIVGTGPLEEKLRRQVVCRKLERYVCFRGSLSPEHVREEMQKARALVLPSLSEGLGRVILEAMASRLVVVASAVGGVPELIEEGVTGFLVPPGDASVLTERMQWLVDHPEEARRMGEAGRRYVVQNFSTSGYVQGYTELFREARGLLEQ